MAELQVLNGPLAGQSFALPDFGPYLIGRDPAADLAISIEKLSRRHCAINATTKGFLVIDLASKNGTFLNERLVTNKVLRSGDVIRIGELQIKFLQEEETVFQPPERRGEPHETGLPTGMDHAVHFCDACDSAISLAVLADGAARRVGSAVLCASCVRRAEALNLQGIVAVEELRRLLGFDELSGQGSVAGQDTVGEVSGLAPLRKEAAPQDRRRQTRSRGRHKKF